MSGYQLQLDPRHLPQKASPDDQPPIPAKQQELEDRQAYIGIPDSGESQLGPCVGRNRIPRGGVEGEKMAPYLNVDPVYQPDEKHFGQYRVPESKRISQGRIELAPVALRNQPATEKLGYHKPHPEMHHHLRHNQERQGQEKAGIDLDVEQEGYGDISTERIPPECREYQQGQPGEQRQHHDATTEQVKSIIREMRSTEELVQRAAQNQREILG